MAIKTVNSESPYIIPAGWEMVSIKFPETASYITSFKADCLSTIDISEAKPSVRKQVYDTDMFSTLSDVTVVGKISKQPDNEIWYTTTDEQPIYYYSYKSNEYSKAGGILEFNDTITSIDDSAFRECLSLTYITIPDSITTIGNYVFYGCAYLTSIVIPDSVSYIGNSAFYDCKCLTYITIPDSVTSIGNGVLFTNCLSLVSVKLPTYFNSTTYSSTEAGIVIKSAYMFDKCSSLKYITADYLKCPLYLKALSNLDASYIQDIADTMQDGSALIFNATEATRLKGLIYIGSNTLLSWDGNVLLTPSIKSGTSSATATATNTSSPTPTPTRTLTPTPTRTSSPTPTRSLSPTPTVTITATPTGSTPSPTPTVTPTIPTPTLTPTWTPTATPTPKPLKDEDMPETISNTQIWYNADYQLTALTGSNVANTPYTINASNNHLGNGTISVSGHYIQSTDIINCVGLCTCYWSTGIREIKLPNSVTSIGNYAFASCSALTYIDIGNSVISIGDNVFWNCSKLTDITIPDSVTSIGISTFSGCSSLVSVTIPDSVTSIGDSTFKSCSTLTSITIGKSLTSICTDAFEYCEALTSINMSDSITSMGDRCFYGCISLTSINFPNSLTTIGQKTCYGCAFTNITIPASVTSIGNGAFDCCTNLISITIEATTPPTAGYNIFGAGSGPTSLTAIYVPADSVDEYKAATNWVNYADKIQSIT